MMTTLCLALACSVAANIWAYRQFWRVARDLEVMRAQTLELLARNTGPSSKAAFDARHDERCVCESCAGAP